MNEARRIWAVSLMALCGLGCGSRAVVGTAPGGESGGVATEAGGPPEEADVPGPGREEGAAGAPVKLEAPDKQQTEGVEVKLDGELLALVRAYRQGGEAAVKTLVSSEARDDRGPAAVGVTARARSGWRR